MKIDHYKRIGLIAGQVLIGVGSRIVGAISFAILIVLYFEIIGKRIELPGLWIYAIIGYYFSMQTGLGVDAYKMLKIKGQQSHYIRLLVQGIIGLLIGLFFLYIIISSRNIFPNELNVLFGIILPLTGAIIGFNVPRPKIIVTIQNMEG